MDNHIMQTMKQQAEEQQAAQQAEARQMNEATQPVQESAPMYGAPVEPQPIPQPMPMQNTQMYGGAPVEPQPIPQPMPVQNTQMYGGASVEPQPIPQPVPMQNTQMYGAMPVPPQPMQQNAQMYGAMPPQMQITPIDQVKKKKPVGVIIFIIVFVLAVLGLAGVLLYRTVFASPKMKLAKGFTNMLTEMEEYNSSITDKMDLETIFENSMEDPTTVNMRLNVEIPSMESSIDTIGIDMVENYDREAEKMDAQFSVSMMNVNLITTKMQADGNTLYVSIPDWVTGVYRVNTETIGKDYNRSEWKNLMGYDLDENLSLDFFAKAEDKDDDSYELPQIIQEDLDAIMKSIVIEKSGDSVEVVRGGNTVKCSGIRVVLAEGDVNQLLKDIRNEAIKSQVNGVPKIQVKGDIVVCFYLDSKNRIVSIVTPDEISFEGSEMEIKSVDISVNFKGEERVLDKVDGTIRFNTENQTVKARLERTAAVKSDSYDNTWSVQLQNEQNASMGIKYESHYDKKEDDFEINMALVYMDEYQNNSADVMLKGGFSNIVKGESFQLDVDKLTVTSDGESVLNCSGRFGMEPYHGDFTMPSESVDFLGMSEEQIDVFMDELYTKIFSLLFSFY